MSELNLEAQIDSKESRVDLDIINEKLREAGIPSVAVPTDVHIISYPVEDCDMPQPKRKTGSYCFADKDSFVDFVNKHKVAGFTMLYGDMENHAVKAQFDDHSVDTAGCRIFGCHYQAQTRPEWNELMLLHSSGMVGHGAFIDAIEDLVPYITKPEGALVFDRIRKFQSATSVSFKRAFCTDTGQIEISFAAKEGTDGANGTVVFPHEIEFTLRPFRDLPDAVRIKGRVKYRVGLADGTLKMQLKLERPEDVLERAFREISSHIEANVTDLRVLWTD